MATTGSPTVVLVHGAFTDASSWADVIGHLEHAGVAVQAVANPLRGLTIDGEYVAGVLDQIEGDVVLVGHSYGGSVISYASSAAANVKALVYVASFGLDEGVGTLESVASYPAPELNDALLPRTYPDANGNKATEFYIQADKFHSAFAADLSAERAGVMAISQRPVAELAFAERLSVEPGWRTRPSWFVIPGNDHAINPDAERAAAKLMGSATIEIPGASHAVAISHSEQVSDVIRETVANVCNG
jgi:pimeloyl-ACP methyl ester carboxylesterase